MNCKIFLGMSGGVDSSVSAAVLKKAGYDVTGVYLLLKPASPERDKDVFDAQRAAEAVGIPFYTYDKTELFNKIVVKNFADEYKAGHTPNPCVLCNPTVKFASLTEFAEAHGGGMIATGHYADICSSGGVKHIKRNPSKKDQSYFLCRLSQKQIDSVVFPLGKTDKQTVRQLAAEYSLPVAEKGDSQEVCFIPDNDYGNFLTSYAGISPEAGDFLDMRGEVIGRHRGIVFYTHGQRRGLETAFGERMYVCGLDPVKNTVTLCRSEERYITGLYVNNVSFTDGAVPNERFIADVKIRSAAKPQRAEIEPVGGGKWAVSLSERQTCAAPGQTCAFYDGDILLGGGTVI